jgi:hypothetical protein
VSIIIVSVIVLSFVILSVIVLSVVTLSVVILSVRGVIQSYSTHPQRKVEYLNKEMFCFQKGISIVMASITASISPKKPLRD